MVSKAYNPVEVYLLLVQLGDPYMEVGTVSVSPANGSALHGGRLQRLVRSGVDTQNPGVSLHFLPLDRFVRRFELLDNYVHPPTLGYLHG